MWTLLPYMPFTVSVIHPFLFTSRPNGWDNACQWSQFATSVPHCTRTRWEETVLICFHRTKAGRQRRARLDRESLGRWPYTPDSDNTDDGVHSQWAAGEALSLFLSLHFLYQFWGEGNEPNQISPWLSITNGSDERQETLLKQALGEIIDSLSVSLPV